MLYTVKSNRIMSFQQSNKRAMLSYLVIPIFQHLIGNCDANNT